MWQARGTSTESQRPVRRAALALLVMVGLARMSSSLSSASSLATLDMDTDTKPKIEQRWFVQIIYTYTMLYLYARVVYIHTWIVLSPAEVATVFFQNFVP